MNQDLSFDPASPLLDHCPASLPAHSYYDEAWFKAEEKAIWGRNWIYVGRSGDLAPLTMRRVPAGGQNLILVKDRQGAVTCFHNTCRHRGAELCGVAERRLKSNLISCPYHQWSYDFGGRLVGTPFVSVTADFARRDHGLFPVRVKDWNGFLYVCLAGEPPEFAPFPEGGLDVLDNWPMRDLATGHTLVAELACNWKIFWENYNECLHCPGVHPELSDMVPIYGRGYMAPNEAPGALAPAPAGLRAGARSWTVGGRPCGPEFPRLTPAEREQGQLFVTLMPTMYVVAHVDYVRAVSLRPLAPERTELKIEWLFPPETLAAPGFDIEKAVRFVSTVVAEDGAACEMNQRGLHSAKFGQGILMPQEFEVFRFQEWIRGQMGLASAGRPR